MKLGHYYSCACMQNIDSSVFSLCVCTPGLCCMPHLFYMFSLYTWPLLYAPLVLHVFFVCVHLAFVVCLTCSTCFLCVCSPDLFVCPTCSTCFLCVCSPGLFVCPTCSTCFLCVCSPGLCCMPHLFYMFSLCVFTWPLLYAPLVLHVLP